MSGPPPVNGAGSPPPPPSPEPSSPLQNLSTALGHVWKMLTDLPETLAPEQKKNPPAAEKKAPSVPQATPQLTAKIASEADKTRLVSGRDPLRAMGAISVPQPSAPSPRRRPLPKTPPELVRPAQEKLREPVLDTNKYTLFLQVEYEILKIKLPTFMDSAAQKLIRETMDNIKTRMAELGAIVVKSAQDVLEELESSIPCEIQDFLQQTNHLQNAMEDLKVFASRFDDSALEAHFNIQALILALETKKGALDADLCTQVNLLYQRNSAIPGDGNCQYESIRHQMMIMQNQSHDQSHYRQLAVQYLRAHVDEFKEDLLDSLRQNSESPVDVDRYFHLMATTHFWGDNYTVRALAEMLKVPIMLFTRQDGSTLRLDLVAGAQYAASEPPLLLYFNGSTRFGHYQDLIPKS